jgi:Domain of unknown function (DUF4062)/Pentatricopeptide repeat domain
MPEVFLSSTSKGLEACREAVFTAIQRLDGCRCVRMEDFGARPAPPEEFCSTAVANCDLFVCIVGPFYGSRTPTDRSFTQYELDAAIHAKKPCFVFMTTDDYPVAANQTEKDADRQRQQEFREQLKAKANTVIELFSTPHEVSWKVIQAIRNWEYAQPKPRELQSQFQQLVTELNRRGNLPYEVQLDEAAANAALAERNFEKARHHLTQVAEAMRRSAEFAVREAKYAVDAARYAIEQHARSLAHLGALAFTERDYVTARKQYGAALALTGLPEERLTRYRRLYVVASNAVIASAASLAARRKVLDEMVAAGATPDVVTYNTLINLAKDYTEGRKVLDEMVAAGATPNEVTLITLVTKAPSFEQGCDLAREAKSGHDWYTGRRFYQALFARPILHLDATALLLAYNSLPLRFENALENPIRQYRYVKRYEDAMILCLFSPHLPSAQKFYREQYEVCREYLGKLHKPTNNDSNYHYCFGIAAHANRDWQLAHRHLTAARELAYANARKEHIDQLLGSIP